MMLSAGSLLLLCLFYVANSQVGQITPLPEDYIAKILDLHNQVRTTYGLAALTWNKDLQASSETYGAKCIWGHSGQAGVGENLAIYMADPAPAFPTLMQSFRDQITGWYDEYKSWTCSSGACAANSQCGHLTQLVSKRTTSVGCGVIRCPKGTPFDYTSQYMVCQYSPAGNMNLATNHPCTDAKYPWAGCPASNPALVDVKTPPPPTPPTVPPAPPPPPKPLPPPPSTNPPKPPSPSVDPPPTVPPTTPSPSTAPPTVPPKPLPPPPSTNPPKPPAPKPQTPSPKPQTPSPKPQPTPGTRIPCNADYWPDGKQVITPCKKAPQLFSVKDSKTGQTTKKPYCDCGAPDGYFWPVINPTVCNYPTAIVSDSASDSTGELPLGAWIGIGVAAFALIVIVVAIIIIVKKKQALTEEHV